MKKKVFFSAVVMYAALSIQGQNLPAPNLQMGGNVINVNTKKLGAPIQSTMYGIFFEDINYAADGGLYGELVKNRSFEFPQHMMGWQQFGRVTLKNDGPFNRCPWYVELSDPGHRDRRTGLVNEGYFGIGVKKGEQYRFSVWAKAPKGQASLRVQLIDESSMDERQEFVEQRLNVTSTEWKKYTLVLTPEKTMKKAKLRLFLHGPNSVCLEHVSLFPIDTYKKRENGMRRDLAQALEDLHPGIFRFPGGQFLSCEVFQAHLLLSAGQYEQLCLYLQNPVSASRRNPFRHKKSLKVCYALQFPYGLILHHHQLK